jgi:hypothetical protein
MEVDLLIEGSSFGVGEYVILPQDLEYQIDAGRSTQRMWSRLIIGGFLTAVGISLLISVCITPIAPKCAKFYGGLALVILVPSFIFFFQGLKELYRRVRR